jgi:hypothetical protein
MTAKHNNQLFHYIIRVPKSESAFTYFQLEANEGLCFYSTLESSMGETYRDLDLKGSLDLKEEVEHLLEVLRGKYALEVLLDEVIDN